MSSMPNIKGRALHWVFKVADREATIDFYRMIGMKVLRHEEFEKGCDAACNGPYDGKWSKTMVGYGPEDNHFVVELTYNYGIKSYDLGNDYREIGIKSQKAFAAIKEKNYPVSESGEGFVLVQAPDGYGFRVFNENVAEGADPVQYVSLSSSDLGKTKEYWVDTLGLNLVEESKEELTVRFEEGQAALKFVALQGEALDHKDAYGRVAFSCPADQLADIQQGIKDTNNTILTPLVSLDTPGKATVQVVILADPDGYEICFVGDEAFRELSQVDPKGQELLEEAMKADNSKEWFAKKAERDARRQAKKAQEGGSA